MQKKKTFYTYTSSLSFTVSETLELIEILLIQIFEFKILYLYRIAVLDPEFFHPVKRTALFYIPVEISYRSRIRKIRGIEDLFELFAAQYLVPAVEFD